MGDEKPFTVYTYRDERGSVLYVGMTMRGLARSHDHAGNKDWWHLTCTAELTHYATELEARVAEREAIQKFCPFFNTQHAGRHRYELDEYGDVCDVWTYDGMLRGTEAVIDVSVLDDREFALLSHCAKAPYRIKIIDNRIVKGIADQETRTLTFHLAHAVGDGLCALDTARTRKGKIHVVRLHLDVLQTT